MSIQHGCVHRKRAKLCFLLLTASALAMPVSIAGAAAQLQVPADVPQKPPPGQELPQPQIPTTPTTPPARAPITLMWEPPTENTNGSALVDLQAYRIYGGSMRSNLKARVTLRNPGLASYVLEPASNSERFYAISAINSKGVESALSNIVDSRR